MIRMFAFPITAALVMAFSVVDIAEAVVIDLSGTPYSIDTTVGTYGDLQTALESQPWWGSSALAEEGAGDVGASLGFPNGLGPYFAYERTSTSTRGWSFDDDDDSVIGIGVFDPEGFTASRTWAVATLIPEPTTCTLALAGLCLAMRRRRG